MVISKRRFYAGLLIGLGYISSLTYSAEPAQQTRIHVLLIAEDKRPDHEGYSVLLHKGQGGVFEDIWGMVPAQLPGTNEELKRLADRILAQKNLLHQESKSRWLIKQAFGPVDVLMVKEVKLEDYSQDQEYRWVAFTKKIKGQWKISIEKKEQAGICTYTFDNPAPVDRGMTIQQYSLAYLYTFYTGKTFQKIINTAASAEPAQQTRIHVLLIAEDKRPDHEEYGVLLHKGQGGVFEDIWGMVPAQLPGTNEELKRLADRILAQKNLLHQESKSRWLIKQAFGPVDVLMVKEVKLEDYSQDQEYRWVAFTKKIKGQWKISIEKKEQAGICTYTFDNPVPVDRGMTIQQYSLAYLYTFYTGKTFQKIINTAASAVHVAAAAAALPVAQADLQGEIQAFRDTLEQLKTKSTTLEAKVAFAFELRVQHELLVQENAPQEMVTLCDSTLHTCIRGIKHELAISDIERPAWFNDTGMTQSFFVAPVEHAWQNYWQAIQSLDTLLSKFDRIESILPADITELYQIRVACQEVNHRAEELFRSGFKDDVIEQKLHALQDTVKPL